MKALVILSTLLNAAIFGVIGYIAMEREDDARFVFDYMRSDAAERELYRDTLKIRSAIPGMVDADYQKLLAAVNQKLKADDLRARYSAPEAVQELLVAATRATIANNEERMREEQASIERLRILRNDYGDFESKLLKDKESLELQERDFEQRQQRMEKIQKDAQINLIVERINKAKKAEDFLPQVQGRDVKEQVYILSQIKKPDSVAAIFNGLPQAEQDAIKEEQSNPLNKPGGVVGAQ